MKSQHSAPHHPLLAAATHDAHAPTDALLHAREFAKPLLEHERTEFGENALAHADAVAQILQSLGGAESLQAAAYLVFACEQLAKPFEALGKAFDENYARLAVDATQMMQAQRLAAQAGKQSPSSPGAPSQTESVRKMLLAFSRDLRVVLLCLASCLQNLRWAAEQKITVDQDFAHQALHIFAPLANRLGIWQIKWEIEDLAFRFLEPEVYRSIAKKLNLTRIQREANMAALRAQLQTQLQTAGIQADVSGRPKHIYSIAKKMRGKNLQFEQLMDVRALRIIVPTVDDCYNTLSLLHTWFTPVAGEFDDYISKPKVNGYQSLHTVVLNTQAQPTEMQIRTQAMHDAAETGVAAHWAYKEAGNKGYAGVSASSQYDAKIAMLRQLLAWERDLSQPAGSDLLADRIYVFTPDAKVVDLPAGATPVDFAYSLHTNLGHRCRGAKVDGVLEPLNTPLKNGQTVEITAAKEGGPSRDWLIDSSYLASSRAKSKVRAWFNALALDQVRSRGREQVEKLLQREGKTALKLDDLAAQLGMKSAEQLFEAVGKDEFSLRTIEQLFKPVAPELSADELLLKKVVRTGEKLSSSPKSDVLVVGVDSLLTQLAKCCRPAPPDAIAGYVTRGKGVSIHRADCSSYQRLMNKSAERAVDVAWGQAQSNKRYPLDLWIEAQERSNMLRDVLDVFAKDKTTITSVQSAVQKGRLNISLTIELPNTAQLQTLLSQVQQINGVLRAIRR